MCEPENPNTGNFLIENSENYAIEIALDAELYVVEKKSKLSICICTGEKQIAASCFGTAYADGVPERWQKDSAFYNVIIESDKEYICRCEVHTKPILLGLFNHITAVKLDIAEVATVDE